MVAGELERRWNERLAEQHRLGERLAELDAAPLHALSDGEHARLTTLGARLDEAWLHPAARPEIRKRILRLALKEIVVRAEGRVLSFKLHWAGGDHTEFEIVRNTSGKHRWATEASTMALIQLCKGAPWIIKQSDLDRVCVIAAATRRGRRSYSQDDAQQDLDFSTT